MNIVYISVSVVTLFLIEVVSQSLVMEKYLKIIFLGIWGVVTAWFFIPFSIPATFSLWNLIEVSKTNIIHISISAAAMIIVGVAVRLLAMNRLPKITFVIIWGLASIRLLLPFSIPARFNVWNLFNRAENVREANPITNYLVIPQWEQASTQLSQGSQGVDNWLPVVIGGIWIVGVVISALYFIVTHYKFRKELGDSLPVENEFVSNWLYEHKIVRSIQIRQSHKISSPLTYGILRPVILIPKTMDWQDETQLKYVFAHEYVHIRRFDYAMKILFAAALCVHWFNPFVWIMYALTNRDIELSCDEAVLKIFGQKSRPSYALALIDMASNKNQFTALYNNFSKSAIEERIQVMINMKKTSILGAALAVTLVGGAMTAFASSPDNNNTLSPTPITEEGKVNMVVVSQEFVDGIMDYDSYKAWREQALEEMINSGDYSTEDIEFFSESTLETLNGIKKGSIVSMWENGDEAFKSSTAPGYEDNVSLGINEDGEFVMFVHGLEEE